VCGDNNEWMKMIIINGNDNDVLLLLNDNDN